MPPAQEALPVDLLLEIVAHAYVTTVVRCAATGKILRRAILEPAFRRRLAPAADDCFDPALLYGVSYLEKQVYGGNVATHRLIHTPGPTKLLPRLDDLKPVASRDGLLVLRHWERPSDKVELRACDTFSGHVTSLPPTTLPNACLHVVLSVGDSGRSFELLVADMNIGFHRTFSSKDNQWSAIRQRQVFVPSTVYLPRCSAVIGRTVYLPRCVNAGHWDRILALDVDSGVATMVEVPPACFSRMMAERRDENLLLATVRGRLCVLVVESRGIAMWTLTSSVPATWSRQVVISSLEIARQAELPVNPFTLVPSRLVGFGGRSGAVILSWQAAPTHGQLVFLRLDLGTKEEAPVVITRLSPGNAGRLTRFFFHEIDLVSLLQAMKSF